VIMSRIHLSFCFLAFLLVMFVIPDAYAQNAKEPWQGAYTEGEFAGGEIRKAYCDMVELTESTFGGLLFAAAGVMAIAFAAFGMSHHSHTAVVVGVGAFTIGSVVSLYFGNLCGGGGGSATARTAKIQGSQGSYDNLLKAGLGADTGVSLMDEFYSDENETHELF
jgi:hypothetical protein